MQQQSSSMQQQSSSMQQQQSSSMQQQSSGMQQQQSSMSRGSASRQSLSSSSFRQDKVSGFARNLGTSQSGGGAQALISSDQVTRHEAGSRPRRTWAESSAQHGQSIYAQDFQPPPACPATKVYASSAFQYERQSSSGHKMFKARENR